MGYVLRLCAITVLVAMIVGCGGNRTGDVTPVSPDANHPQPAAGLVNLPAPVGLAERAGSALTSSRGGSDYDAVLLPEQKVLPAGEKGLYEPTWLSASESSFDDLAYALYTFELPTYEQGRYLNSSWSIPPASGSYWVALGNMVTDSWKWFNATPGQQLMVPGMENYINTNDVLLAVVVVAETGQFMLDQLWFEGDLPDIVQVTPIQGDPGNPVTFNASLSGNPEFTYVWDFGGATIPNQSTDESPNVIFGTVGKYDASLTVTNGLGVDTFDFALHVGLPIIVDVSPTWGISEQEYTFTANVFSTQPVTYAWDFGGGGSPDNSDLSAPVVTLGASGEYPARLTVLNSYGADNLDFTLTVKEPPVAALEAVPTSGVAPFEVSLDASGSYDPDGSIILYEWDWDGDGNYDHQSGTNPITIHTYADVGEFHPTVRITDDDGAMATATDIVTTQSGWFTISIPGAMGDHTSLAVVDEFPAISFRASIGEDLAYVRATNVEGTEWGTPVVIDSIGNVGRYSSLTVVNGNPAISYKDDTNAVLKYVRANDSTGTTWSGGVVVDGDLGSGYATSLTVVNDRPAIAYGSNPGQFRYVRAEDSNGISWVSPIVVGSSQSASLTQCSLSIVNGNPAVVFNHHTSDESGLVYRRAEDIDGNTWWPPVIFLADSSADSLFYPSLAVVNGKPAISFVDWSVPSLVASLKYVIAEDADGDNWLGIITLANLFETNSSSGGWNTSLASINGKPAISCYDKDPGTLRSIDATDIDGTNWGAMLTPMGGGQYSSLAQVNGQPAIACTGVKYCIWQY